LRSWHQVLIVITALLLAIFAVTLAVPTWRQSWMELLPATWRIRLLASWRGVDVDHSQRLTMVDGTQLTASLYRPRGAQGPLPTILVRLPYHRLLYSEGYNAGLFFAHQGYAVLVQDLRGTGESGGELLPWSHAADDAVTTIDWIARQTWSNGRVGSFGCSALGETQLLSQDRAPANWQAMIVSGAGGAVGSLRGRHSYFGVYEGGVFQLASGVGWFAGSGAMQPNAPPPQAYKATRLLRELPISTLVARVRPAPNGYSAFMSTPLADRKWREWGYLGDDSRLRVPVLTINTWGDQTVGDTLALAEHWREANPEGTLGRQKVVIAPGAHCGHEEAGRVGRFGVLTVGNADQPYKQWYLRWFDHWLRGRGDALAEMPAYTYYVVGADTWLQAGSWPPPEARVERWYLASDGRANSRRGNGRLTRQQTSGAAADHWRYDPGDPVPSKGGPICCTGDPGDQAGPADQAEIEERNDVLVYTSPPLTADLWIAGPLTAHLMVSSDAKDTDVIARLVHVWPDGRATSIQEGALRLRYRNGFAAPELLEPGSPVRIAVDMRSIAYRLPQGHRLRLHLTSSSFPRLERNLNTGGNNATEAQIVVANNRVHYGVQGGSWLELPILPR
jgi:uncharacterized protein